MDGKYINVIAENGCKATTETCHKISGDGLALAEKIKIIKNRIARYKKTALGNEFFSAVKNYHRMREAEEILKILEDKL